MNPPFTTTLHTGKFLALIQEGHWEYVDRTNATGAALILAVTPEQNILLVEQYRIPVHARTIELPAGIIGDQPGDADESKSEAARWELLATELQRTGKGGGVAHEDITVHEVPLNEIATWLEAKAKAGVLIDPKVYAGLFFVRQNK